MCWNVQIGHNQSELSIPMAVCMAERNMCDPEPGRRKLGPRIVKLGAERIKLIRVVFKKQTEKIKKKK